MLYVQSFEGGEQNTVDQIGLQDIFKRKQLSDDFLSFISMAKVKRNKKESMAFPELGSVAVLSVHLAISNPNDFHE